jgi:hypothetical protein
MNKILKGSIIFVVSIFINNGSKAGVPLNNLEGVGGIAFNPLAYPAGTAFDQNDFSLANILSKPQLGNWYVHLGDSDIDWTTFGISETFFKRLEVSYGYETIAIEAADNISKNNFGAKFLLVEESDVIPAISVGTVFKNTTYAVPESVDDSGTDYYLVATKLIKELPKPVLLSGGIISTKGQTLGVLGFNNDSDESFFGNIDVLPLSNIALGLEYRQGAEFDSFKNANYWNAHLAWFANKNLTLVGAYVNAGDTESTSKVGLGDGVVLSLQYAF